MISRVAHPSATAFVPFVNNKENYKNREMLIAISKENMRIQEIKRC